MELPNIFYWRSSKITYLTIDRLRARTNTRKQESKQTRQHAQPNYRVKSIMRAREQYINEEGIDRELEQTQENKSLINKRVIMPNLIIQLKV